MCKIDEFIGFRKEEIQMIREEERIGFREEQWA